MKVQLFRQLQDSENFITSTFNCLLPTKAGHIFKTKKLDLSLCTVWGRWQNFQNRQISPESTKLLAPTVHGKHFSVPDTDLPSLRKNSNSTPTASNPRIRHQVWEGTTATPEKHSTILWCTCTTTTTRVSARSYQLNASHLRVLCWDTFAAFAQMSECSRLVLGLQKITGISGKPK